MIDEAAPYDRARITAASKALLAAIAPIRRHARRRMGQALVAPPLELLYWVDNPRGTGVDGFKNWPWRAIITLLIWADQTIFAAAPRRNGPRSFCASPFNHSPQAEPARPLRQQHPQPIGDIRPHGQTQPRLIPRAQASQYRAVMLTSLPPPQPLIQRAHRWPGL